MIEGEGTIRVELMAMSAPNSSVDRLAAYGAMLLHASSRVNLTSAKTPRAIAELIADAFSLVEMVDGPLIDIGSGGGLPGIPLAIMSGQTVTLIEATGKKSDFLRKAVELLEINAAVITGRAEAIGQDAMYRERFRHATARAVGAPTVVAEFTIPFLEVGGTAFLPRVALTEAERASLGDAALMLGARIAEERSVGPNRCIVVLEKLGHTQPRFPRRTGIPAKRPLCV